MLSIVVLAAGEGTRMRKGNKERNIPIDLPKVCQIVKGKPMIQRVIQTASDMSPDKIILVVSENNTNQIKSVLSNSIIGDIKILYTVQNDISGTGSAVLAAENIYDGSDVLVLLGDVPFISSQTLSKVTSNDCDCVVVGYKNMDPNNKFGRIVLGNNNNNNNNKILKIVEYNDATEEERQIKSVNSGMIFLKHYVTKYLHNITNNNSKSEYYLTDIVEILNQEGFTVKYIESSENECFGINTHEDIAHGNTL
jgi:bifunctional UDP-N-acetylglucosamine pyrophosphorylase/glucosamine-1-phosphate N-acetyltransferase